MTAVLHLTNNEHPGRRYAIEQGANFRKVTFMLDRDLTGWTVRGEIRTDYRENNGLVIAEFDFDPLEYKPVVICGMAVQRSLVIPTLSSSVTTSMGTEWVSRRMTQRRNASDQPQIGRNVWVYDVAAFTTGERMRISQGFLEVDLEVTA
ncbi:MAG: hypothetical protein KME46_34405 [Brasilonema angustatum HA4187-MV1]|jgi:hypothetical protein|nr:hypothetical protein [Brasilonema angustatum HA4187-MV1]